jgi:hypothetical protein
MEENFTILLSKKKEPFEDWGGGGVTSPKTPGRATTAAVAE